MKNNLPKGHPKLLNAWAFYDWANSVYSLTIASAIFPLYYELIFKEQNRENALFFGFEVKATAMISFVTAFAFLLVAIMSPILSGISDYIGNKKAFLRFFCYLGGISCILLYWFTIENLLWGYVFYFFGLIGFWASLVFYNSYLPDIAFPEQQDRVSARGFSMGYIGCTLLLIINLAMVMSVPTTQSLEMMRWSFVTVGVWWIGFSHVTYYYLPKGNSLKNVVITKAVVFDGFNELKNVWRELKQNTPLKKYLNAYFVFIMAVQTVMLVAAYFGATEISWKDPNDPSLGAFGKIFYIKQTGLILCILIIQIVAILGAILTSRISEKIGNIKTLILLNAFWFLLCVFAYFVTEPVEFYSIAGFVGLVMGGIQSLARSTYSKLLPETSDTASYFSFYDVTEKVGIVIGMTIYGTIDQITGSMRNAIVFLGIFFISGMFLLMRVPKNNSADIKN